jgi:glycosyltransferase involved in cell wall biosynthesis
MLAEKIAIRRIDVLITVSEPIAGLYRKKFPDLKDVEVIRNVPKQEVLFDSQTHNIFPETHKKIILYQGHFKPGRGLLPLIEAMTFIDEAHLVLIGGGELEDELLESIKMHDVQHKISLLGYIPTDRLITVASTTDLGIVLFEPTSLNYKYALPNKLFEYIMAGLPVLASNIETFRFYIDKYKLGLTVDPQNAQKIAQQIRLILSDEQKLEEWRKNAKHASTILNWENESKILEKVYEQIQ